MQPSDNDIILFAKTNFRNREVPFGIRRDDRRRHMYIIGKTGMGKTTLIENMVVQDILNGHGVTFVDPHGDSVEKVLDYIPANRINDVIYFNPADVDFPIAFNPLEAVDPRHKHLVASGLMGVFTKIWAGVWSPRMEYILQNTILALLDSPGNTMLGIARMYVDKAYRKKIVDNIKDPVVRSFWVDEFANYQDKFRTEAVAPIQNKVGQFLSNAIIRNIVGQTKSTIDLREIMDQKKILLLNLSKGRIGEDSSALLGAMIITKLQLAAMSRVDVPEEQREDFYLYVDEFQNFATDSFASILSEARKYRLNLIVAHQYIGQLVQDRNTVVRDAIFGNVGTMITFRVGADDAEFLEKEFEPVYTMNDLVNLSKWSIYLKLMINGVASNPFSASTLPPIAQPTDNVEKVIKVSRERYAVDRETVEKKISKWLGAEFHSEAAKVESDSLEEEGVADELRFRHAPPRPPLVTPPGRSSPVMQSIPGVAEPAIVETKKEPVRMEPKPQPKPEIRHEANSRPKVETRQPFKTEAKSQRQDHRYEPRKPIRSDDRNSPRQDQERRVHQTNSHPHMRNSDKAKSKHENPIWDTVNQLATEKKKESAVKTNQALDTLSKGLQKAALKDEPRKISQSSSMHIPPVEPVVPPTFTRPAPEHTIPSAPKISPPQPVQSKADMHLADPELPKDHLHPDDKSQSPHHNIQDVIARHGQLNPGQTVKFDD
ncbi:MAG: type IV secretion system DNA-binding domain-containing protein [Candidatus Doudnabacteria bacterium]|nr:type IV secretion system DNA-binding domain-containing protein [Candidatus Doudnabacteria bacterium]